MNANSSIDRQYRSIADHAPVGVMESLVETCGGFFYVCGHTRNWTDMCVSPGVETVTGYTRDEFESAAVSFDMLFDPALVDQVRRDYTAQLNARGRYVVETTITAKDRSARWIKDSGVLLRDDGPPRIFGVCVDVSSTEHERHLRRRAEREAERFIAFKARAVSVLAHEIRTPLNVLCGYIDLIKSEAEDVGQAALQDYAGNAAEAARLLTQISASAVKYAETADWNARKINTTLLALARDAIAMVDATSRGRFEIRLNEPALGRAIVNADRVALVSVFAELLENVARHAHDRPTVEIDVRTDRQGGVVALFEDDGRGLADSEIADAVAPFVKPGDRENVAAPGIGLGLPRIAEIMAATDGALYLGRSAQGGLGVGVAFSADDTISASGAVCDLAEAGYRRVTR